jgi:CspA family cold shock protein
MQRRPAFGQRCWVLINHRPARAQSLSHGFLEIDMAPMNGTIKRLVSDKGFGFILASDGNEYFFHNSACSDTRFDDLREGQAVTFERGQGPKGPRGENVRVA